MVWLEMMPLIAVLLMVAGTAAAGGFWVSGVTRRTKPRARMPFVLGVCCGLAAGLAIAARRRGLGAVGSATLRAVFRPGLSAGAAAGQVLSVAAACLRRVPAPSLPFRQTR